MSATIAADLAARDAVHELQRRSTRSCSGRSPSSSRTAASMSGRIGSTTFSIAPRTNGRRRCSGLQSRDRLVVRREEVAENAGGALAVGGQLDAAAAEGEQRLAELLLEAADGG